MPPKTEPRTLDSLLGEARTAFKTADYARSEELFQAALEAGADELDCRQHLARIYNLLNDWPKALQQWLWLREHAEGRLRTESQLQVARGQFRLKNHEAAAAAFEEVLASQPDHPEARKRLLQISTMQGRAPAPESRPDPSPAPPETASRSGEIEPVAMPPLPAPSPSEPATRPVDALLDAGWAFRREDDTQSEGTAPDRTEAPNRVAEIDTRVDARQPASELSSTPLILEAPPRPPVAQLSQSDGSTLVNEAKAAFNDDKLDYSKVLFMRAIERGADEAVCRLHLARIGNLQEDWEQALEHWIWLRDRDNGKLEPYLQIGRAELNRGSYAEAADAFERVLALAPDHAEAKDRLQQARTLRKQSEEEDLAEGRSWLSVVPEGLRWQLAKDALHVGNASTKAAIDMAIEALGSLDRLIQAFGEMQGDMTRHRQLYAFQAAGEIDQARRELRKVRAIARAIDRRTAKMIQISDRDGAGKPASDRPHSNGLAAPRPSWRGAESTAAVEAFRGQGFDAAILSVLGGCPLDRRATALAGLGDALQDVDRSAAIRAYWLAFGATPSPSNARFLSVKLHQSGDPAGSRAMAAVAGRRLDGANGQSQENRALAED